MKKVKFLSGITFSILLAGLTLNACGPAAPEPTPTGDVVGMAQTAAVETFAAGLTQTAFMLPTDTPVPIPTETPTNTTSLATPLPPVSGQIPTASCYGLSYVKDVTIPDNTAMTPGQSFTKTWRVRNSGSCDWETGFKFAILSGNAMSGATFVLDSAVKPGVEKDLSIAMKAPLTPGSSRGTWRMSTASGNSFGDQVFVLINVVTTITPTVTRTGTLSITPTKTGTFATPTHTKTATATTAATTVVPIATTVVPIETTAVPIATTAVPIATTAVPTAVPSETPTQ
jgi:hypothetical protein